MPDSWTSSSLDLHVEGTGQLRRVKLEEGLRSAIQERRLTAGTALPSSRALAADLGLSRGTVTAAYDQLAAEGYLVSQQGSGTQVADLGPVPPPSDDRRQAHRRRLDLRPGTPDVNSFPVGAWLKASRIALTRAPVSAFGYGEIQGRMELRTALASYLGRTRGVQARPEQIVITSGTTQGVFLLASARAAEGCNAWALENPGFRFHRDLLRQSGRRIVPLPVDRHGPGIDGLEDAETALVTPAHQYPSGVTMHATRRRAFTSWARRTGGLVIEDDYDGEFRYDRQPIGALQGTAADQVVYIGSASKTLGPGLRLGWMVVPERLVEPVVEAKMYSALSTDGLSQLTLAEFINSHAYDRHIRTMRLRYRRRRDMLNEVLAKVGPPLIVGVPAGLSALIGLPPDGPDEADLIKLGADEGLTLEGSTKHWHEEQPARQGLIIGFAHPSEQAYPA
ncbi:MAG TPA: PLP-dependent aminotransferase family protein, partial [Frankiaceae bacterium]|nr:PLP-dependent aminotransferase family protein [Frankiaceae bacterium]